MRFRVLGNEGTQDDLSVGLQNEGGLHHQRGDFLHAVETVSGNCVQTSGPTRNWLAQRLACIVAQNGWAAPKVKLLQHDCPKVDFTIQKAFLLQPQGQSFFSGIFHRRSSR